MRSIFVFFLLIYGFAFAQDKVEFLPVGGNYLGLKDVKLEIPKGWSVYFTRDGTIPNKNSEKATHLISIKGDESLYFAIYKSDNDVPTYKSNTYITSRKQTLPYFSIITDPNNLFDPLTGIYEKGCCASKNLPYKGANFWKDIEKPIHIEFIDNKKQVINQEAGIEIFGGYSKSMPQKSFAIIARKKYGENQFNYPLFPQLTTKKYNTFILRNAGGDMQGAHIRDPFSSQLIKDWGLAFQEYRPVAVYINGKYWGIYGLREKTNEEYIQRHFGIKKSNVSIIRPPDKIKYKSRNTLKDYQKLIGLIEHKEALNNEDINEVNKIIDIEDYLKYSIIQIYFGNSDAATNIRLYKDAEGENPYKTILYDLDMGLAIFNKAKSKENSFALFTSTLDTNIQYPKSYTLLLRKLLTNDSVSHTFINYFIDAMSTFFNPQYAKSLLDKMTQEWKDEIGYHRKRWDVSELRYETSIQRIQSFLEERPLYVRQHLKNYFNLQEQFQLRVVHKLGGSIQFNSLILSSDFKANYYKGIPIAYEGIPDENYEFIGWKGQKSKEIKQFITVQEDQYTIEAIFESKKEPIYLNKVILSELKISHPEKGISNDWIEFLNISEDTLDLSNWVLKDNQDTHVFTIKNGTLLLPNSYLILSTNKEIFRKEFGMFMNVIGDISFGFNENDKIRLYDNKGYLLINFDLSALPKMKNEKHSWVRKDIKSGGNDYKQWAEESPIPGDNSLLLSIKNKADRSILLFNAIVFYGIILVLLIFIVFFYYFGRRIDS